MYGLPIARKLEKWWYDHGGEPNDDQWEKWTEVYLQLTKEKAEEWLREHKNQTQSGENVFGMAKAGGCTRASGLSLIGEDKERDSGSTKFTFFLGHTVENAGLATLHMAGYPLLSTQHVVEVPGLFASAADASIEYIGQPTFVSVKSAAYKMSGRQKGKFVRRGFPELPLEGIHKAQPNYLVQGNLEAYVAGYKQWIILVIAKDIVKVFEDDDFMNDKGNGSLTFYTELFRTSSELAEKTIEVHQRQLEAVQSGSPGDPMYFTGKDYVKLYKHDLIPSNIWGGKNKELTGKFNPCGGCNLFEACKKYA